MTMRHVRSSPVVPELTYTQGVRAWCQECASVTTFERGNGGSIFGQHGWYGDPPGYVAYVLLRCAGCNGGAIAQLYNMNAQVDAGCVLVDFHPKSIVTTPLPPDVPEGVGAEFREAEVCASAGAYRAASAMLRSALEKVLVENGYDKGVLYKKIEDAAADGVLTESRRRQAHDKIRSLGNDVVHEDWHPVSNEEFELAYRYTQRVIEDLYESREAVVVVLTEKGRLASEPD